ncbi:hypothetical protein LCGC14_1681510 [marine sediment metagenome]|uniref:Uncharacterized protein n=1 Tax=marine sediment metagenome TaxID=412755 RepID=A0A0F9KNG5_9ZZZZ
MDYKLVVKKVKMVINDWASTINNIDAEEYLGMISEIIEAEEKEFFGEENVNKSSKRSS